MWPFTKKISKKISKEKLIQHKENLNFISAWDPIIEIPSVTGSVITLTKSNKKFYGLCGLEVQEWVVFEVNGEFYDVERSCLIASANSIKSFTVLGWEVKSIKSQ